MSPEGVGSTGKVPLTSPVHSISQFVSRGHEESPLRETVSPLQISTQVSTLSIFPKHSQETFGAGLQVLLVPQPLVRSACLLLDTQEGETPPRFLGIWCWIPQLPEALLFMDGCLIKYF